MGAATDTSIECRWIFSQRRFDFYGTHQFTLPAAVMAEISAAVMAELQIDPDGY